VNLVIFFYSIVQAFIESRRPASSRFQTISCKDRFNDKVVVAVGFSFLAFLALSGNALISMANLFSRM
jgi:hypothetical protein